MAEDTSACGCTPNDVASAETCCRIEAVVSVDERGQLVLPKDVRTKLGLLPGEKLAVVSYGEGDRTCCVTLVRADALGGAVRGVIGPLLEGR